MTADFVETKPVHKYPYKSGRDILEAQYKSGRALIDRESWARSAYDGLRRRCPHIPDEELVRLFHDRSPSQLEMIQGDALFREYNAAHPIGRRKTRVKPRRAPPAPAPAPRAPVPAKAKPRSKPAKAKPPAPAKARKAKPKAVRSAGKRRR